MNLALLQAAERRAANTAEAESPTGARFIGGELFGPRDPGKLIGFDLGIGRCGTAECLAASRAVAAAGVFQLAAHLVLNASAKTLSGYYDVRAPKGRLEMRLCRS